MASRKGRIPLTAIDLFAGCGGLSTGLHAAGFQVLAAVEKDKNAAATYAANHRDVRLYTCDIRDVSAKDLLQDLGLPPGQPLDLIAGCPPCQGFTRLTENNGRRDPRNELVREYLRFVKEIRPRACMLENVPGLRTRGKAFFDELCEGLDAAGYRTSHDVLDLANYGVPQFRKRLVLLACHEAKVEIPPATHHDPSTPGKRRWRTVRDAIGSLPSPPLRSEVVSGEVKPRYGWHYARDVAPIVRERLDHALANGGSRAALPASLRLACHERNPDGYYDVYGVMDWDSPSPAITSGCTNASKGRFGHPDNPRPLTATEAALLQTFSRGYRFRLDQPSGTRKRRLRPGYGLESVAAQIGNALPPRFAKVVAKAIAKQLSSAA